MEKTATSATTKRSRLQKPTREQYHDLFRKEWSDEKVEKPSRDVAFWILRLLGFGYLIYLIILVVGLFGSSYMPSGARNLINLTYYNPALAINTYFKITLMIMLAFIAAYNKSLRFYACAALLTGHLVSAVYGLVFHFYNPLHATGSAFLLLSAEVDGVIAIAFFWIMLKFKKFAKPFAPQRDFPINFSIPLTLMRWFFAFLGIMFLLIAVAIILCRILLDGGSGIGAVFGAQDPMIGNTIILYSTLSVISFLLVRRDKLRQYFYNTLIVPLVFGGVVALLWIIIGGLHGGVWIHTRQGTSVQCDWYFVLHGCCCLITAGLLAAFRRMVYRIDYALNTLSASSAISVVALTDAFFGGNEQLHSAVMQSIDEYAGGIKGRKRGLLNLPFALFENVLSFVYGLHPQFSSMDREEQRYFLRNFFFRNEMERRKAIFPFLANFAYQIGLALNSMIAFAYYSHINVRNEIGYVPPDARDRLQGDCAAYDPPHRQVSELPKDPEDAHNFKPVVACDDGHLVAPRVSTPVKEEDIPDETDYVIIGSGAGGASAAYHLARAVKDPSRIVVVERGRRYQPLQDFQDSEMEMMKKVYKEGGLQQTKKFTMTLLQGECVGGSTIVNNAVCFQMPDPVFQSWQNNFGIDLTDLKSEYEAIAQELNIGPLGSRGINRFVKNKFEYAVSKYNEQYSEVDRLITDYPVLVNHINNVGDGNWNLGNKRMRKRSMLETYIPWSESRGVKIISNLTAVRFTAGIEGSADSVMLRTGNGEVRKLKVKKAVIVAGGAVASSHFLMRSEVMNKQIGRRLSCNFAFPVVLDFEDELKAYDGDQITLGALDPHSRSAFETYFNPPAGFALSSVPFFFERRESIMQRYSHLVNFGCLLGSEPNGIIQRKASLLNGQAFTWELGEMDVANIKYGINTLVEMGMLAEARRIILPTKPGIDLPLNPASVKEFIQSFNAYPLRMSDLMAGTAHPQGGNIMSGKDSAFASQRVVDENFLVAGYKNVFVADASIFPTSITINPQWTIMAMSSMAAKKIAGLYE